MLAVLALLLAACGSDDDDGRLTLTLHGDDGKTARLRVEVADTAEERQRGLMGRTKLDDDAGMLFVIEQRGPGFWMKDTLIPLSVAFIAECGEIVALADMEPLSLQLHGTDRPYRYGLEVNQGWFASQGIGVGGRVEIPSGLRGPGCA